MNISNLKENYRNCKVYSRALQVQIDDFQADISHWKVAKIHLQVERGNLPATTVLGDMNPVISGKYGGKNDLGR